MASQRDVMRAIWKKCKLDQDHAVEAYVLAEEQGDAPRASNTHGWSSEQYARALLRDGLRKGWV